MRARRQRATRADVSRALSVAVADGDWPLRMLAVSSRSGVGIDALVAVFLRISSLRHDGHSLDLDLGLVLDQSGDLDYGHGREVAAHRLAIDFADALEVAEIVLLVGEIPGHRHDMLRPGPGLGQHVD